MTNGVLRQVNLAGAPDAASFRAELGAWLADQLPADLPGRRWFGDKSRSVAAVALTDLAVPPIAGLHALAIVTVSFDDGGQGAYLVPVSLLPEPAGLPFCALTGPWGTAYLCDGLLDTAFRQWLLRMIVADQRLVTAAGATLSTDRAGVTLPVDPALPSRLLGVEQSNSSLVYGDAVLVKVFRRLQPGLQPDVELVRFLSGKAGFSHVPRFAGALEYRLSGQEPTVLAAAQEFVQGTGDGWSHVLATLADRVRDGDQPALLDWGTELGRQLGELTGSMHLALAADPWSPEIAPEPIREADIQRWSVASNTMLERMLATLRQVQSDGDDRTAELIAACLAAAPGLRRRVSGFDALAGRLKTRVHGDLHLGQLLRRPDGSFVVLDFEGEPARPVAERRLKTSPLKDVAGMLRSFGYARGTAAAAPHPESALPTSSLIGWERAIRAAFLDSYVTTVRAGGGRFLPDSRADLDAAVAAWELDKATYEVVYELDHRPDWLWIPLSALVKHGAPER